MNNHYQLYVESVLTLAETIVIKFDDAAQALNYQVTNTNGADAVDDFDKTSWKYYQNISGQYHFTDTMIRVTSLDTAEVIDFTKENLQVHLATRSAYAFGTRHYKELVQNHPGQELLILGILNPTPIHTAIEAEDGTILRYPAELVESNERSFISKLQTWIYQYLARWVNGQYGISDDLYVASYIAQLYLHLVQAIINLRLEACKTPEAHSFHVRQYLASHGGLDVYLDQMTQAQALFFYRNILYIQRHAGKRDTFDWLVENVMSVRHLPLYEYTMAHNVAEMGRDSIEDNARLLPAIEFKRKGLNSYANATDIAKYTLDAVLAKVDPLAPGNRQYNIDHAEDMRNAFAYGKSSVSMTKMLESSVTDYSDAAVYTLADILLNHWLGMVGKGRYVANVVVQMAGSGDVLQLNAQDAVALYIYAVHRTGQSEVGFPGYAPLVYVPKFQVNRFTRLNPPPVETLLAITERTALTEAEVQQIRDTAVPLPFIVSIEAFYNFALEVAQASALQHAIYASKEDFLARGEAQMAVSRLYDDETLTLSNLQDPDHPGRGIPYIQLFQALGIDLDHYTQQDFYNLAATIASAATGINDRPTNSLGELQRAMVNLFAQLSSYSIQVITEINTSNLVVVENPAIRVSAGTAQRIENFHVYVDGAPVQVLDVSASESQLYQVPIARIAAPEEIGNFTHHWTEDMDITSRVRKLSDFVPVTPYKIYTGTRVVADWDFVDQVENLTLDQRNNLVDMYSDWIESVTEHTRRAIDAFTWVANHKPLDAFTFATTSRMLDEDAFTFIQPKKTLNGISFYNVRKQLADRALVGGLKELDHFTRVGGTRTLDGLSMVGGTTELDKFDQPEEPGGAAEPIVLDTFTGANFTPLSSREGELNARWQMLYGDTAEGVFIADGVLRRPTYIEDGDNAAGEHNFYLASMDLDSAAPGGLTIEFDFNRLAATYQWSFLTLYKNGHNYGNSDLLAQIGFPEVYAGSSSASLASPILPNTNHHVKITVVGAAITVFIDDVQVATGLFGDELPMNGKLGFAMFDSGDADPSYAIDNFTIYGTGTYVPPPAYLMRDDFTGFGSLEFREPDTMSTGAWEEDTWYIGDSGALGTIAQMSGDRLVTTSDGGNHWSFSAYVPLPGNPLDAYIEARLLNNTEAGNTGFNAALGLRRPGVNMAGGVFCDFYINDATTVSATFGAYGTPNRSFPDFGEFTVADANNFVARMEAVGRNLRLFLDGVLVMTVVLNAPMATGGGAWIAGNPATYEYVEAGLMPAFEPLLLDSFTETSTLAAHTGDSGVNWLVHPNADGGDDPYTGMHLVGGKLISDGHSGSSAMVLPSVPVPPAAPYYVEFDLLFPPGADGTNYLILYRADTYDETGMNNASWTAEIGHNAAPNSLYLYGNVASVGAQAAPDGTPLTVRYEFNGASMVAKVNGVTVMTDTDSMYQSLPGGYLGFKLGDTNVNQTQVDNYEVGFLS